MDDSAHGDFLDSSPKPEECVMQDPPYPSDTRAKGWRLEIDHERIDQSDTWALAKPEVRPWLLMLWLVAWKQTPCGSLPAEDDLIAARIGMSAIAFSKHRAVLMRGWWLAEDGRLYHNVLVQRVQEMLAKRMKDAERAAKSRSIKSQSQANHAGVTRDADVTHAFPTREFDTKHQAPDTSKRKEKPPKPHAADAAGFAEFWSAWPRKVGKAQAEKAWTKLHPSDDLVAAILRAIAAQSRSPQWLKDGGQFIPHPATWLNGKRWEDETDAKTQAPGLFAGVRVDNMEAA